MGGKNVAHHALRVSRAWCNDLCMSEQTISPHDLEPDLADRMRKALRVSGVGAGEIAEYLGVARNTVSTWINGRIVPSTQTLRLWALRTGVPFSWLQTGQVPGQDGGPGGGVSVAPPTGLEPATDGFEGSVVPLRAVSAVEADEADQAAA